VPIALALATLDYVFPRNLIGSLPLLLVAAGAALTTDRARWGGAALLTGALALSVLALVRIGTDDGLQRDDVRSAAAYLDKQRAAAIVVSPANDARTLSYYLGRFFTLVDPGVGTRDIAALELTRAPVGERKPPRTVPGFRVADVEDTDTYRLVLLRAPSPVMVGPALAAQAAARPEDAALVADLTR